MAIKLSQNAIDRIKEIRIKDQLDDSVPLRVGVVGGGCSGLSYKLEFDKATDTPDKKDKYIESEGITIVIDMRSFLYLAGTELDYSSGLNGKGFHFINPNATRTCSCGESFAM
ncbi:MAG: iron-sulfur cluster assembly accessory protein [Balneolales bacterium]